MSAIYSELKDYKFDQIIYLKKYLYLPSSSLFKTLKKLHKTEYESNERIVFAYQGQIPYDLLAHLQRIVAHIDITNFFVIVCNNDPGTKTLLDQVHAKYSNDPTKFELLPVDLPDQHLVQDLHNHRPLLNPPETMCMYPWNNIEFKPNGTARPCCLFSEPIITVDGEEFNINNKTVNIEDLYFSPIMKNLRQEFRDGIKPKSCIKCWKEEAANKKSDRQLYNWVLRDKLFDIDYESENVKNITSLDLKLGNLCNLSCRICNPMLSSSWAAESLKNLASDVDKKKSPAYTHLKLGEWPKNNLSFWDRLAELLPHLIYIQFAGGEPLLTPYQFTVLDTARKLDCAKNITLRYNTNATQCPEKIFDFWKSFKLVHLDLSIDDIGQRFEYQRNGADWNQVCANVKKFNQERRSNFKTQVSTAVSVMNILYLPELCDWYNSQNFDAWWLNVVWTPGFCITDLTERGKDLVLKRLTTYDFGQHHNQVDILVTMIQNSTPSDGKIFNAKIRDVDLIRNQDLRMAHHEIAQAMGYVLN